MKISDYTHADCTLFRRPPLPASEIDAAVASAVMKIFENGGSASNVVDTVTGNKDLMGSLTGAIANSLKFQREQALKQAEDEKQRRIKEREAEKAAQMHYIDASLGDEKKKAEDAARQSNLRAQVESTELYAAQQRLNEMRAKISARMDEVGGEKGYNLLEKIDGAIVNPKKPKDIEEVIDVPEDVSAPSPSLENKVLEPKATPVVVPEKPIVSEKPRGRVYKIYKGIVKVLTYKIW